MTTKDRLRKIYRIVKYYLNKDSYPKDFDYKTLPDIDKAEVSIDSIIQKVNPPADLPYNLKEKLEFWQKNGYVVLENVLPKQWLDNLWEEVETTIENHKKYDIMALAYQFNGQKDTPIKDFPKEKLHEVGTRLNNYHNASIGAKRVMTHANIAVFLQAVLDLDVVVFQSLIFKYGSQQDIHQDFPWVTSNIPSHLAAAWIPLEDVHPDSGPLAYYPGSHKIAKFNFGTGILKTTFSVFDADDFAKYLGKKVKEDGIEPEVLLVKKGDVLIWHGALVHAGTPIKDITRTRKSFVCHYSTVKSSPKDRYEQNEKSLSSEYNGVKIYVNPLLPKSEDIFTDGKDW
jgi:phytanoyl-CoA hydroxylase